MYEIINFYVRPAQYVHNQSVFTRKKNVLLETTFISNYSNNWTEYKKNVDIL